MATLATQQQDPTADLVVSFQAAAAGDHCLQDGNVVLHVKNAAGSDITVTITSVATTRPGLADANKVVTVTAGTTKHIGPLSPSAFADPTTNLQAIAYSSTTSVTVAAVRNAPTQN